MTTGGKILLVDDDGLILTTLSRWLRKQGYEVVTDPTGEDVPALIRSARPDVVLLDVHLPGRNGIDILREVTESPAGARVVMLTSDDTAETAIKAMKLGACDYLTKPFNLEEVGLVVEKVLERERLEREVHSLRLAQSDRDDVEVIGETPAIRDLRAQAERMAEARVTTLLITGESGTGKEVLARYIHRRMFEAAGAGRAPFIAINCTALPESLLESELFGYEKGAFTDAKSDKKGVFELAHRGSILLDEIGDMKQEVQSKLLRIVERRAVRRIGGGVELPVEVTVMATTNRDLSRAIEDGGFRMDLFFRLNAFALHVPPLRERQEDIPLLARHYLDHFCRRYKNAAVKRFSPEAERLMVAYRWPGNVRELKNVVERLVVLERSEEIRAEQLPKEMARKAPAAEAAPSVRFLLPESGISLEDVEKDLIVQALDRANQNKAVAAKLLDVTYQSLRYQIKKFGLE